MKTAFVKPFLAGLIASQSIHLLCCGLPLLLSVVSLFGGLGLTTLPFIAHDLHEALHDYERPMLWLSGLLLVISWAVYVTSRRLNCHDTQPQCTAHGPCQTKKDRAFIILLIATILFLINFGLFWLTHSH